MLTIYLLSSESENKPLLSVRFRERSSPSELRVFFFHLYGDRGLFATFCGCYGGGGISPLGLLPLNFPNSSSLLLLCSTFLPFWLVLLHAAFAAASRLLHHASSLSHLAARLLHRVACRNWFGSQIEFFQSLIYFSLSVLAFNTAFHNLLRPSNFPSLAAAPPCDHDVHA